MSPDRPQFSSSPSSRPRDPCAALRALPLALLLSLTFSVALPCPAAAGPKEDQAARALADTAYDLAKAGRYDDAIDLYRKAHELSGLPAMLFNVAKCYEKKGDDVEARTWYRRYLDEGGDDPSLVAIARKAVTAEPAVPAAKSGRIEIVASRDGARVRVDDRDVGRSPVAPVEAEEGRHTVAVTLDGHSDFLATVSVRADQTTRVDAMLQRVAAPEPARPDAKPDAKPATPPKRDDPLAFGSPKAKDPRASKVPEPPAPPPPPWYPLSGADPVTPGKVGLVLRAGYPYAGGELHLPVNERLELALHGSFFYGRARVVPLLGGTAGLRVRYRFVKSGGFSLAFTFDPAVSVFRTEPVDLAIRALAPGLVMTYAAPAGIAIHCGLSAPVDFVVYREFVALVPILFRVGMEVGIGDGATIGFDLEMGPEFWRGTDVHYTDFRPDATFTLGFRI